MQFKPREIITVKLQGEDVELSVDTISGIRMVYEKRLRNIGASARFRQKKKEKEKEMHKKITSLQKEIDEKDKTITAL